MARCPACGGEFSGVVEFRTRKGALATRPRRYCGTPECARKRRYVAVRAWYEQHRPAKRPKPRGPRPARSTEESRKESAVVARSESGRRWGIDPCTSERLYEDDERQFLMAMETYKRRCRRPFPTWSEALQVLVSLGYRKVEQPGELPGC
jgi:hypothetical protein